MEIYGLGINQANRTRLSAAFNWIERTLSSNRIWQNGREWAFAWMSEALDRKKLAQLNLGNLKRSQLNRTESNVTAKTRLAVVVAKQTEVQNVRQKLSLSNRFYIRLECTRKNFDRCENIWKSNEIFYFAFPTDICSIHICSFPFVKNLCTYQGIKNILFATFQVNSFLRNKVCIKNRRTL